MSSSPINGNVADGTVETRGGSHILRLERHLPHPIEQVWAAITEPEQLVTWLAEVEIDLCQGGQVRLHWLKSDGPVTNGTITQLEPPRLLEYTFEPLEDANAIQGVLRWELQEVADVCLLTLSHTFTTPNTNLLERLAGWHTHLDFLAEALDGQAVDWPRWPRDRWAKHYERYCHKQIS